MLFFIISLSFKYNDTIEHLNTSHVILYQTYIRLPRSSVINLNTSHVILYHVTGTPAAPSLSHLNTSHVILYHLRFRFLSPVPAAFKYISCYSLSKLYGFANAMFSI